MPQQNYTPIDDLVKKYLFEKQAVSYSKEAELPRKNEAPQVQEIVEHEPNQEVKPFVSIRPETIKLPSILKQFGLQPASTTSFPSYQNVKLPISDDKVLKGMHAPITSSLRWLATLAMYILLKAHLTLRVAHGKVIRVIKR